MSVTIPKWFNMFLLGSLESFILYACLMLMSGRKSYCRLLSLGKKTLESHLNIKMFKLKDSVSQY